MRLPVCSPQLWTVCVLKVWSRFFRAKLDLMTKSISLCFIAFFCAASALACNLQADTARLQISTYVSDGLECLEHPPATFRFDTGIELAFVDKINAERTKKGLNALSVRPALLPAARYQSLDMGINSFFDHESPDGRRASDRIAAFDRTLLAQSTGENIAVFGPARCYDQTDTEVSCFNLPGFELPTPAFVAEDLHQKLMDSEGHRANIMSEDFTHVAIGVARTDTGFYVTQVFANRVGVLSAPLPTQFATSNALTVSPNLTDWGLGGLAVIDLKGTRLDLERDDLRDIPTGSNALIVRGENSREEKRGSSTYTVTEWLDLSGPSFTLLDAKGS